MKVEEEAAPSNMTYREQFKKTKAPDKSEPDFLQKFRSKAFERFREFGFPTHKAEGWKYLNLESILGKAYVPTTCESFASASLKKIEAYYGPQNEEYRLVFLNGCFSSKYSRLTSLPRDVRLGSYEAMLAASPEIIKSVLAEAVPDPHAFAAINSFSFTDGGVLTVPKGVTLDFPVRFLFFWSPESKHVPVSYPRLMIRLEESAKADIVVHHVGLNESPFFLNAVADIHLGKSAKLNLESVQKEPGDSIQLQTFNCRLQEQSRLDMSAFAVGGKVLRNETVVDFMGENGFASLSGLSVLSGDSRVYQHATVNHNVPNCKSRQLYKSILGDKTQSEFNSAVHVVKDAQNSDSQQMNRNLLLSDNARAYSRPQLKIYADDVKCNHGAANGQLEGRELFYLRSRGLDELLARFVLAYGFAEEILADIRPLWLRGQLEIFVRRKLEIMLRQVSVEE